jgi:hypothetical protein
MKLFGVLYLFIYSKGGGVRGRSVNPSAIVDMQSTTQGSDF